MRMGISASQADSISFLSSYTKPVDVLYLDSLDTTEPGHAEHCLQELQAALPRLRRAASIFL